MNTYNTEAFKGTIDFAIITMREDEFESVLQRFPLRSPIHGSKQLYEVADLRAHDDSPIRVAIVRTTEQGQTAAQSLARDVIDDIDPQWLILAGIAGGVPDNEFSLGDVLLATRLHDFSVTAAIEGKDDEFQQGGGPPHPDVEKLLAALPAWRERLGNWNAEQALTVSKPTVNVPQTLHSKSLYGSTDFKRRVRDSLRTHFPTLTPPRSPLFRIGPGATSNALLKNTKLLRKWQESARHLTHVEMEAGGVYQASRHGGRRNYPLLCVRGISDIIGFKREPVWTSFACHSAASFVHALLTSGAIRLEKRCPMQTELKTELPRPNEVKNDSADANRDPIRRPKLPFQFANDGRQYRIQGGVPLRGRIVVRGAKNTLPKQMVAALLTTEPCLLRNVARIRDVEIMAEIIRRLGGIAEFVASDALKIDASGVTENNLSNLLEFSELSRIPILLCAPLLHRFGKATIPKLGGCELAGKKGRPINFHLQVLTELGADVHEETGGVVRTTAHGLYGNSIRLPFPSVGATEQLLLAAVLARGTTRVSNASLEPEVVDLIDVLQQMGANIHLAPTRDITVQGVDRLRGFDFASMPDRSELGSWACAAAATGGSITIAGVSTEGIKPLLERFEEIGGQVDVKPDQLTFSRGASGLKAVSVETGPHPQFRTDWQPPFLAALTQASGQSMVHETVFPDRLGFAVNLMRMGANIEIRDHCIGGTLCRFADTRSRHSAVVYGPATLRPTDIVITDLRGGFASVLGALIAKGESMVRSFDWLEKGYEDIEGKLKQLGAQICRSQD